MLQSVCLFITEYQSTVQWLCTVCSKVALNIGNDSTDAQGTDRESSANKSESVKLALRMMLRSFPFCTPWMMRLGRLHAFLAKHCPEYTKSCLAIHPPALLINLSALDEPVDVSVPLIAVEYLGNLLTTADGSTMSFWFYAFYLFNYWYFVLFLN